MTAARKEAVRRLKPLPPMPRIGDRLTLKGTDLHPGGQSPSPDGVATLHVRDIIDGWLVIAIIRHLGTVTRFYQWRDLWLAGWRIAE